MKQQIITDTSQTININNLDEYKGQILVRETLFYKWMFVLVEKRNDEPTRMLTTQGLELVPLPRFYMNYMSCVYYNKTNPFFNITTEYIPQRAADGIIRLPTKNEFLEYTNLTRGIRILGQPSLTLGKKIYNNIINKMKCKN